MSEYIVDLTKFEQGDVLSVYSICTEFQHIANTKKQVTRCKDCNRRISPDNGFVDVFGQWYCEHLGIGVDPDFFCADGESVER